MPSRRRANRTDSATATMMVPAAIMPMSVAKTPAKFVNSRRIGSLSKRE